jgi:hypothetical protein
MFGVDPGKGLRQGGRVAAMIGLAMVCGSCSERGAQRCYDQPSTIQFVAEWHALILRQVTDGQRTRQSAEALLAKVPSIKRNATKVDYQAHCTELDRLARTQ